MIERDFAIYDTLKIYVAFLLINFLKFKHLLCMQYASMDVLKFQYSVYYAQTLPDPTFGKCLSHIYFLLISLHPFSLSA